MSSETVGLKVERQRRVGLIQEQVDPGQLDAIPLKHRPQNLAVSTWREEGFRSRLLSKPKYIPCGRSSHLRVFFFIAGTISVFMSTLRSNLRLKHSLLGSCSRSRSSVRSQGGGAPSHCAARGSERRGRHRHFRGQRWLLQHL